MLPMIPLMARAAAGVGFGLTMSTTYHHPFHIARLFNSLDHVTGGRIAWNAVTSAHKNEAANWGYDVMIEHGERYARAQEHLAVTMALWETVEDGALIADRESGIYADPDKVHLLNHRGKYYNVRGPLPVLRSPQGRPVVVQAGQSDAGMNLAATYADLQFSTRRTLPSMQEHRAKLDAKLIERGRSPRDVGVLWSVRTQVAESLADAKEKERRYNEYRPAEAGLIELSAMYGVDFSAVPKDIKMADLVEAVRAQNAHWGSFLELVKTTDPSMTLEQFARNYSNDRVLAAVGTPAMIADKLEEWHHGTGANGGFMLARGFEAHGNLRDFVDLVVPELQRRGLTKKRYAGPLLRQNLGMA
jgi:FMN-dependent oxidoreductase (nitrilotriacetate monooxygenase family)